MTSTETILQCENCLRFFANGAVVSVSCGDGLAMARAGRIESFVCSEADCTEVVARNKERDLSQRQANCRRLASWKEKHLPQRRTARGDSRPTTDVRSSCPVDTEPLENPVWEAADRQRDVATPQGAIATPAHAVQVRDYGAHGEADNQNELMLAELRLSFDESCPSVPGDWVSNYRLTMELKIGRTNNRARSLRGYTWVNKQNEKIVVPPHPFIEKYGLDVDCTRLENSVSEAEHWGYRLCLKSQSERLKRESAREEANGQKTF